MSLKPWYKVVTPRDDLREGKVMLPKDALEVCNEYADWVVEHRQQLPSQFNVDGARNAT